MKPLFERIGYINTIEDIFDKCIIEKNNWLMYGSSKPHKEPYKITDIYNNKNKCLTKITVNKTTEDYVKLFSIRNKKIENKIK